MKNLVVFLTITLCLATTCWFVIKCDVATWQMFIPLVIAFLLVIWYAPLVFFLPISIYIFIHLVIALPMLIFGLAIWLVWITIGWMGGPKYQSGDELLLWSFSFGATVLFWILFMIWLAIRDTRLESTIRKSREAKFIKNSKSISS